MKHLGLLFLSLVASHSHADILNLSLTSNHYAYKDSETSCSHAYWVTDLGFNIQVKNGHAVGATLVSHLGLGLLMPDQYVDLSADELAGITFYKDSLGRLWVKTLPLSEQTLRFAFNETASLYCSPPQYSNDFLVVAEPSSFVFEFDTAAIEREHYTPSQVVSFHGYRYHGEPYEAEIQWVEQQGSTTP